MLTTTDVEVLELCTKTVTSTPITSPDKGLDMMELLLKNCPATFPEKQTHGHDGADVANKKPGLCSRSGGCGAGAGVESSFLAAACGIWLPRGFCWHHPVPGEIRPFPCTYHHHLSDLAVPTLTLCP